MIQRCIIFALCAAGCASREVRPPAVRHPVGEVVRLSPTPFLPGASSGLFVPGGPWDGQPVQGFSGLTLAADGGLLAVTDNGFGVMTNSDDFYPRVFALDFADGALHATPLFRFADAQGPLTGADLDPEALVRAPDGTFWVGEEFGPSLVHVDAKGVLLGRFRAPETDGGVLRSPDAPELSRLTRTMLSLRRRTGTSIASPHEALLEGPGVVEQLHRAGFKVVPWTVNDPARMAELISWGVDGLISDRPDLALAAVGTRKVEVQGHRGARGLRPESTLPGFELALSLGAQTLELDLSVLSDGGVVVWHDSELARPKCSPPCWSPLSPTLPPRGGEGALVCDGLLTERFPEQRRDVGPFTTSFVVAGHVPHAFSPLTLRDLLDFLEFRAKRLPGSPLPHLNIETKGHRPGDAVRLREHLLATVAGTPWEARSTLQSFDFSSLSRGPLPTVALVEGAPSGLEARVPRSGGFENLALSADGKTLFAMLEKPLDASRELLAFSFDLASQEFTGVAFRFPLDPRAVAVGDLTMVSPTSGLALERDDSDGKPDGYKRLVAFELPAKVGDLVTRRDLVDLVNVPSRDGGVIHFDFWTIEGVARLPDGRIAVIADNNFPFGRARHAPDSGIPDETELLLLEVP